MNGHIDQIDSVVHFETRQMVDTWDKQIESICFQVNSVIDKITTKETEWLQNYGGSDVRWCLNILEEIFFYNSEEETGEKKKENMHLPLPSE